ncbi:MAG: hypothetical protein NTU63_03855 [Candidatus Pacearchaeota archaeon]|nr:hypothetical protein [Candidatus Pacearchaeota archaeon]
METKKEGNNRYVVSINGENTKFEVPINNVSDFENLEIILDILKRKLA